MGGVIKVLDYIFDPLRIFLEIFFVIPHELTSDFRVVLFENLVS